MSAPLHGLLAEFSTPDELLASAQAAHAQGYVKLDAYSPFPVDGLAEAIGFPKTRVSLVVLIGGIIGGVTAYFMQWYSAVIDYPLIVAGRPLHSWPSFIPITFELTVLFACFAAVFGMLTMNGLPRFYHPVFNAPNFSRVSSDRFYLCIEAADPKFDLEETRKFLISLKPNNLTEVEK